MRNPSSNSFASCDSGFCNVIYLLKRFVIVVIIQIFQKHLPFLHCQKGEIFKRIAAKGEEWVFNNQ